MKRTAFFALAVLAAFPAFALDLQEARTRGIVREQADGYVSAAQSTPEVQKLVTEVNAKRRAEYQRISRQNGQPVDVVARLAAEQIAKAR